MSNLFLRITGKYHRTLAYRSHRRMVAINTPVSIVSFTFDDAPTMAFEKGGDILRSHGARGTFFVSLGLLGSQTEAGAIASADDLLRAVEAGHELGCHTFDHLDTWETTAEKFTASVVANKQALERILPGTNFRTFAYPKSEPRPAVKSRLERYFICCRGGGQIPNVGVADLNLLKACFLDRRTKVEINFVERLIDYNAACRGWLIFATHDVANNPSRYGCTPKFFEDVVGYAVHSGALLLPVAEACEKLQFANSERPASK